MLEFSNFQIFMMVLHGCLLLFAFAFLFGGNTRQKNKKIISYREFQRQKNRRKAQVPENANSQPRPMRDVRDVSEIYGVAAGSDYQPHTRQAQISQAQCMPTRLIAASSTTTEDTITHFTLDTISDFDVD